jgi:hypothetical protein
MKRLMIAVFGTAILVLMLQAGCSKDSTSSPATSDLESDRAAVEELISSDASVVGDSSRGEGDQMGPCGAPSFEPIEPLFWWRQVTGFVRQVEASIEYPEEGYPYANVTITLDITGTFNVITVDSTYRKDLHDVGIRYAYLERRGQWWNRFRGWELVSVSGVEIISQPSTRTINSLHVTSSMGTVDTVLTDVSTLVPLEELFNFQPGEEVTLTVDTGDETDVVFLHTRFWRAPFTNLGGGIFEGTWTTNDDPVHPERRRRAAVDVIEQGTLFDSEEPYDSYAWAVPYYVGRLGTP